MRQKTKVSKMKVLSTIRYHYYKFLNKLCLSRHYKEINTEKIKKDHKIKKMFFEFFKNGSGISQQIHKDTTIKDITVSNIYAKVYYEGISFCNVTFKNLNLEQVCFHNCKFTYCNFENITTYRKKELLSITDPKQGFSCCDFMFCNFNNCNFDQLFFSVGILKCVDFKNVKLQNVVFQMNSFSQVRFLDNCSLYNLFIASPSGMFDISFIGGTEKISIDAHSVVTDFKYRDKVNVENLATYSLYKKDHYKKVASTYYAFEQLFIDNNLLDKSYNCYYQRKKAETRSKDFLPAISGYFCEWIFGYGEHPFKALVSLLLTTVLYAPIYMITGFNTGSRVIDYSLNLGFFSNWSLQKLIDLLESLYYSFFTLVTVGQGSPSPESALTRLISSSELFIGAILITTFTATLFRKITK